MPPKKAATKAPNTARDINLVHLDAEEQFEQYSAVCDVFKKEMGSAKSFTFDHLLQLFQRLDASFTEENMRSMWDSMDRNKSGDVDWFELLHYLFDMDKWMQAGLEDYKGLIRTAVFCRIRPIGEDGHGMGEEVEKKLDGWTEKSVFVKDRHERLEYKFPEHVLPPEASQEDTYRVVMHQAVDAWLINATNVMLFAYGQTGSGKTHTMFGPRESLSSDEPHDDWGLFPRAAHKALTTMETFFKAYADTGAKMSAQLRASAIEFYLGEMYDLLNDKAPLAWMPDGAPVGKHSVEIKKISDLASFLDTVAANRTMSGTKMNSGSSRSHCALILTLADCGSDPEKDDEFFYLSRSLTLLDMAGSERPDKAGTERVGSGRMVEILYAMAAGNKPTKKEMQGLEGSCINFELSSIKTEIAKATEQNQRKKKYQNNCFPGTALTRYIGRCLVGQSWLSAIVCLSQSPQNGWETWFSCEYGEGLAKLQAPVRKAKYENADALEERLTAEKAKAKQLFEATPEEGSAASRYYGLRQATLNQVTEQLQEVQELLVAARAHGSSTEPAAS